MTFPVIKTYKTVRQLYRKMYTTQVENIYLLMENIKITEYVAIQVKFLDGTIHY